MLKTSPFGSAAPVSISIPDDADIVFVADMFAEDYAGGAELTSEALIKASPLNVFKLRSADVTMDLLEAAHKKFWVFGNFSNMQLDLIPTIAANMKYAVLEYDYKYCKYRSPEKHERHDGVPCNCHNDMHGKLISAFYYAAKSLWWMSEKQFSRYCAAFPFLREKENCVLSSVFDDETFASIKLLREAADASSAPRQKWIVLGSPSWIKGADDAIEWCKNNGKDYEVVWDIPHAQLLQKLSKAEGHVYLPRGGDTCPRMVIEAKLLGCQLELNDNVEHASEEWFNTDDTLLTESYLYAARKRFWDGIVYDMDYKPKLSGYTTTLNCVDQDYPFEESIRSMLEFCDEVCVVDGGSTDDTLERLLRLSVSTSERWKNHSEEDFQNLYRTFLASKTTHVVSGGLSCGLSDTKIKIKIIDRDWNHPRFAVFDGMQKAEARKMCTSEFCWQQDSDEIVHEKDYAKITKLVYDFPKHAKMIALPVIEYWGSPKKVRCDIMPWKWRLSVNDKNITHGIPGNLRRYDSNGDMYSAGSDGCDPIDAITLEPVQCLTFYTNEIDSLRKAVQTDEMARAKYEFWYRGLTNSLPSVQHFSWLNIERKIKTYKGYWQRHWNSLFNVNVDDTAENNMFFDRPWSEVTDDDIVSLASRLAKEFGGWIFHRKIDFSLPTKYVTLDVPPPANMSDWIERNTTK